MKLKSNILYFVKIITIVLLSVGAAWLLLNAFYFSSALLFIGIIVVAISVYHDRRKLIYRMERMISSIRNSDFSYHFPENTQNDELSRLTQEMNEALEVFRSRAHHAMMDEAEPQAWQKLISVLTHEIMNSIAPIISLSETLSEQEISRETNTEEYRVMRQAMETIYRRSRGLLVFVENYRKLTRLPQPSLQPIHLSSFLQSLQQLNSANDIHFTYSVYPEQLLLMADREMLEQMLINLLKNAKEACEEQSEVKIDVKAQKVGDEVQLIVSDNGSGISPDATDKIFIPFFSTKKTGSGIGLSLCRQVMIRHKGKISVQSDKRGSRFTLEFPQ